MTPVTSSPLPTVDAHEALSLLAGDAVLLDVREHNEWDAGHAPDALHVPLGELAADTTVAGLGRQVLVVCRSGRRSAAATSALRAAGIDAHNLDGGMQAWRDAGAPLVTDHGLEPIIL